MSISLPNGTILSAPSSSQAQVSAAVTRILHLSNFSPELKTRDLQMLFKDWESDKGGFRVKWVDDVNALIVFADASVAKRAYLSTLVSPPPSFKPPSTVGPYDRPDAAQIIASLAARSLGHRSSMSSTVQLGSISIAMPEGLLNASHSRAASMSSGGLNGFTMPLKGRPQPVMRCHQRTGSASSSWARQSTGVAGGVLNFSSSMPSSGSGRLPTHSEKSSVEQSRSSSAEEDVVVMDSTLPRTGARLGSVRRESVTADRALREVEKALASVETHA